MADKKTLRPNPTISEHRHPSLYAELMLYPDIQRTGRLIELAQFGLECMKRGGASFAPAQIPSAKPIEPVAIGQTKPIIDDSAIDLDPESGL